MQHPTKYFHKRLNSTNLYASQIVHSQTRKNPFWVRTDDQFAGKGQGIRKWSSEPGLNLTGTLVIFPEQFAVTRQFDLSKVFAVAAAAFLELFLDEIRIKWPNDLYHGDRKIGGILIETAILGNYIDHAILGIGININQLKFPSHLPNPVSISSLTGQQYDLTEMETLFLELFLNQYRLIENEKYDEINRLYVNRLYKFEENASFKADDNIFTARIIGVNEYGHLIIETAAGNTQTFAYQEIEYIL